MDTDRKPASRRARKDRGENTAPRPRNGPAKPIIALALIGFAVVAAGLVVSRLAGTSATSEAMPVAEGRTCTTNVTTFAIDRGSASRYVPKIPAYTQGLLFADGVLYESTGTKGRSAIYRLDQHNGSRSELFTLDRDLFGEGLALYGGRLYQLTWRAGLGFVYQHDDGGRLQRTTTFRLHGEGWGLTDLADELVLSDGSDELSFLDPQSFSVTRRVQVRLGDQPLRNLNELETVGGKILANVYGDDSVVVVDPANGCVTGVIDASRLIAAMQEALTALRDPVCPGPCSPWDFVLNGIAYDEATGELYLTGKNWPMIFVYRDLIG